MEKAMLPPDKADQTPPEEANENTTKHINEETEACNQTDTGGSRNIQSQTSNTPQHNNQTDTGGPRNIQSRTSNNTPHRQLKSNLSPFQQGTPTRSSAL